MNEDVCNNIYLHLDVSASLVVKFFEEKTKNHRAMFSRELHKSIVHGKINFVSLRQDLFV